MGYRNDFALFKKREAGIIGLMDAMCMDLESNKNLLNCSENMLRASIMLSVFAKFRVWLEGQVLV